MDSSIDIKKTVVGTQAINKVVDTKFRTFVQPTAQTDPDTIDDLFRLYDKFYYEIDLEGDTKSHTYLIKRSSELVKFQQTTEDIQPLLDEIAQLRELNLSLNQQLITLQS